MDVGAVEDPVAVADGEEDFARFLDALEDLAVCAAPDALQLRALAEAQNVRRRAQQDVEKERKFGVERFARDVLSVADNFGRALSALPANLDSLDPALRNVIVGIQATDRELQSVLERHGVTRIESLGKPFNAEFHQAMMEVENADVPNGTVVQEMIPGYLIAGRLLRAAMVAVSKGGPAAGAPAHAN